MAKPPVAVSLAWKDDLLFAAHTASGHELLVDGHTRAAASPVELLAIAAASCMSIDVAHILTKSQVPFAAIRVHCVGERAQAEPHRFVALHLRLTVEGPVPQGALDRAVELSRDKYCSVWNSLRADIPLEVTTEILAVDAGR